jgi:translation initiation factor IF-2
MTDVTVKQFAIYVGIPIDRLLEQFSEAGIAILDANATVTEKQKVALLAHLRKGHGNKLFQAIAEPKRITLKRKTHSEIKMAGGMAGQVKTVSVEVRKKRTYVKRSVEEETPRFLESDIQLLQLANFPEVTGDIFLKKNSSEGVHSETDDDNQSQFQIKDAVLFQEEVAESREQEQHLEECSVRDSEKRYHSSMEHSDLPTECESTGIVEDLPITAEADVYQVHEYSDVVTPSIEIKSRKQQNGSSVRELPRTAVKKRSETQTRSSGKQRSEVVIETQEEKENRFALQRRGDRQDKSDRRKSPKKSRNTKVHVPLLIQQRHGFAKPTAPVLREVIIPETISVAELAQKMSIKATEVIKAFFKIGVMVTINQVIDQDNAALIVSEMGHSYKIFKENALEEEVTSNNQRGDALPRPPVVTIMGHVDHGKTSLLDYIRRTRVAAGEAGGITQHIGAYHVRTQKGVITFLDTPGHAAFTAMRARGARATDVVVLVVAADDGVMPQTLEAIQHARAANVPLVVAVNKMDKASADPERVKSELSAQGIISEEWGGDTLFAYVSAKSGLGVDDLLVQILLQAEMLELKASVEGHAKGIVIESRLDKGRGPVATLLIQSGTLCKGDVILSGLEYGRVRAMLNESGQSISEAGPSIPVEVLGLSGSPRAGDEVITVTDERKAREIALFRQNKMREEQSRKPAISLDDISKQFEAGQVNILNVVMKADVQGSAEAIVDALSRLSTEEVQVKIIVSGIGSINESDVNLACNAKAIIIGFNVRADSVTKKLADEEGLKLHYYSVIYELIEDVRQAMVGMLKPEFKEEIIGLAEVRSTFRSPKFGIVAGCMVVDGIVRRNNPIRVLRNNVVIFVGALDSLRRFKDDVGEVRAGIECGIGVRSYNDIREGDHIEVFERVQVERTL